MHTEICLDVQDHEHLHIPVASSKFRNNQGVRLTRALFYEFVQKDPEQAIYTIKDYDWNGYPSLYRLYMEMGDLTEYEFANTYLENWDHWLLLCSTSFFEPVVTRWRQELDLKVRSEALKRIRVEAANGDSKNQFQANKILIDRTWESKLPSAPRGRPSNDELKNELKRRADEQAQLEEDLRRINGDGT